VRVPSAKAPKFAYIGQNGTFWLVLRPALGAQGTGATFVTANNAFQGAHLVQHPTRTLVSLDAGIDEQTVRASLPASADIQIEIGRAHVLTPVTVRSRMPSSA